MADKTHVNFGKVGNCVRNKAYPEEIWRDKGKKSNFQKVYKIEQPFPQSETE